MSAVPPLSPRTEIRESLKELDQAVKQLGAAKLTLSRRAHELSVKCDANPEDQELRLLFVTALQSARALTACSNQCKDALVSDIVVHTFSYIKKGGNPQSLAEIYSEDPEKQRQMIQELTALTNETMTSILNPNKPPQS